MAATGERVAIIGAGIGGLSAAALLAARGYDVTVLERAGGPGGKMAAQQVGTTSIDGGPTVFTMRHVLDAIFADAGASLQDRVPLVRAGVLAQHHWGDGSTLALHADHATSRDAIGRFAGAAAARGFDAFHAEAARTYATLAGSFIGAQATNPVGLTWRLGWRGVRALHAVRPYTSLWRALGEHFADPRLRQLFARYATYTGSSPMRCPATLMLIAHVESTGVWLAGGGMSAIATALADVAGGHGARFRYHADVATIRCDRGRATGVTLACGEAIDADVVIANADPVALAHGRFGAAAARGQARLPQRSRSLSALAWLLHTQTGGIALQRHNVFFSSDYPAEFANLSRGRLPAQPSIYVCAQDRDGAHRGGAHRDGAYRDGAATPAGSERLQIIINAPAIGDALLPEEIAQCQTRMLAFLQHCGLCVRWPPEAQILTTPAGWQHRFPQTAGALYGRASHGWAAAFRRPGARTALPGLYLAGGATHPGAGVPMAALSGRLATEAVLADRALMARSRPVAMPGGTSMRSPTMAAAD
jgi:1-hydroxycarotenoid 3,4-desaturase